MKMTNIFSNKLSAIIWATALMLAAVAAQSPLFS
jgi:hypothetical protein